MNKHSEIIATWAFRNSRDFAYFDAFESPEKVGVFWADGSRFRRCFDKYLDLTDTVEIACGAGRHSAQIAERCGSLVLVDTSPDALQNAAQRFADRSNVHIKLSPDGFSIPIDDRSASAVFSYDAMVHFEPLTVASYLRETARVLRPGGRAILHHSSYGRNPTGKFTDNPDWRNFMPKGLFMHLADRAGLKVIEHQTFRWGSNWRKWSKTDALSVLEK